MADIKRRRVENVAGDFYVDETCIDCDTCRWMAPEVFRGEGGQSAVYLQPKDDSQREKALQALVACPTASIGVTPHDPKLKKAVESFPIPMIGFREVCWYSWPELVVSTEKLLNYEFEWVLPGHGRRFHASKELMKMEMKKCLEWMKK